MTNPPELPPAGPTAKPHIVEILVAPWHRISVMFRSVHTHKAGETGSIWYWRPMSAIRLDQTPEDSSDVLQTEQFAPDVVARFS